MGSEAVGVSVVFKKTELIREEREAGSTGPVVETDVVWDDGSSSSAKPVRVDEIGEECTSCISGEGEQNVAVDGGSSTVDFDELPSC